MRSKIAILVVLSLCPFFIACPASTSTTLSTPAPPTNPAATYTKISQALLVIAQTTGTLQNSVIVANSQKILSDANTKDILLICGKVNTFVGQASTIIRGQAAISTASKASLVSLIDPLISAFQADINQGLLGITDVNTKSAVSVSLLFIQTTLSGILVAIS